MISRRTALRAGIGVAGAVGGTALLAPAFSGGVALAADLDPGTIAKYTVPMPVPKVLRPSSVSGTTSTYTVTMKEITKEILPGRRTTLRTYNGEFPGPVIKARSGERVVIKQINGLAQPTSVHLHGAHVPQDSDGGPMDLIAPGGSKTYTYPNRQPHANLWFHDHAHHEEAEHVYRGLSGFYLLTDDTESRLDLPQGPDDVPIALREARFDESGELVYAMDDFMNRNTILVNGAPWPYFSVEARKYRFRVFNQSNLRFFDLRLGAGETFWQIGGDGGLLERPLRTTSVKLSPGERADIVIDFAAWTPGTRLELTNTEGPGPVEHVGKVMQFRVRKSLSVGSGPLPSTLRTLPPLPAAPVRRSFDLSMDEDGRPGPGVHQRQDVRHAPDRHRGEARRPGDMDRDQLQQAGAPQLPCPPGDVPGAGTQREARRERRRERLEGHGRPQGRRERETARDVRELPRRLRLSLPSHRPCRHGHDGQSAGRLTPRPSRPRPGRVRPALRACPAGPSHVTKSPRIV
jgi:FtsP/CotA-like multicopper oxidase with cupredoxin domain